MTAFESNEDLKDCCLLLGADTAVTFFKKGLPLIPEPFYETYIIFPKDFKPGNIAVAIKSIRMCLEQLAANKFECTDIVMECRKGIMKLIYTVFTTEKKFTTKRLKYID